MATNNENRTQTSTDDIDTIIIRGYPINIIAFL